MAKYSICAESIQALDILGNRLRNFTDEILSASVELKNVVLCIGEGLGVYFSELLKLIENNIDIMQESCESLIFLANTVEKKAADMEIILKNIQYTNDYTYKQSTQIKRQYYEKFENKIFGTDNLMEKYQDISLMHALGKTTRQLEVIKNYTGTLHAKINKYLSAVDKNEWSVPMQKILKENINVLTDSIEMNELPQQGMLYRGINAKELFGSDLDILEFDELKEKYQGKEYRSARFLSTSCIKNKAEQYAEQINGAILVFVPLRGPRGCFWVNYPHLEWKKRKYYCREEQYTR